MSKLSEIIYRSRILALLAIYALVVVCLPADTIGAEDSAWLGTGMPTFDQQYQLTNDQIIGLGGNRDCDEREVITRPAKLVPLQSEIKVTDCFVDTAYGMVGSNGWVKFNSTGIAGKVINFGAISGVIGIPNSPDIMHYVVSSSGAFLSFSRNIPAPITIETLNTGEVKYKFNNPPEISLRNLNGNSLPVQLNTLSFSSNGQWMVVGGAGALIRINVQTLEMVPFAPLSGLSLHPQIAVSDDGRYAVVASPNSVFKLYDLSTCTPTPAVISGPVSCQSRDLWSVAQNQVSNFSSALEIRFVNKDLFTAYLTTNTSGISQYYKYSVYAPGIVPEDATYLALGDSFASGEGDTEGSVYYEPGTDSDTNKCHLSKRSYPYLINEELGLSDDFHSVACSGADIDNIVIEGGAGVQYANDNPSDFWLPGYQNQLRYMSDDKKPKFLTISIGGNDVGFSSKLRECVTSKYFLPAPSTCKYANDANERANVAKEIADQYYHLKGVYSNLVKETEGQTKVYAVGYTQFIQAEGGSCDTNVFLDQEERHFVRNATAYMNDVIESAAKSEGVYYLDIEDSLANNNLCSFAPQGSIAVNGLTEGDDKEVPWWLKYAVDGINGVAAVSRLGIGNESYHPNQNGHGLMKKEILRLLENNPAGFTICPENPSKNVCPEAGIMVPLPDQNYYGADAVNYVNDLNGITVLTSTKTPQYKTLTSGDILSGRQLNLDVKYLLPGSLAGLSSYSTPTDLGQFIVNDEGNLKVTVTIPETVEAGIHTLRLKGTTIAGESVEYYEHIFVPGPDGDINNNGTSDTEEACGFVKPSGQDKDYDGIDDACDGYIGPLPPPTVEITEPNEGAVVSGSTVTISADAGSTEIAGVQFQINGVNIGPEDTEAPYSIIWDSKNVENGHHTITATARNTDDVTETTSITVDVLNVTEEPPEEEPPVEPPPIVSIVRKLLRLILNFFIWLRNW